MHVAARGQPWLLLLRSCPASLKQGFLLKLECIKGAGGQWAPGDPLALDSPVLALETPPPAYILFCRSNSGPQAGKANPFLTDFLPQAQGHSEHHTLGLLWSARHLDTLWE